MQKNKNAFYFLYEFSLFIKLVICLPKVFNLFSSCCMRSVLISFLLSRIISMLAFSYVDRRAIFRKFLKSLSDVDPDPSAILFDIERAAALNCSANL